ncbi:MAG: YebC/PmpR family DNA-binding transcriptional regulator [Chitinophagales bacterium]|jgi:YebC/PmpR family DNA-binding regulatory protein|nr:YebC/PmpR family DNA-binding transcriptional regulator [Chitinophagales bacterium]
MGRIFEKRKHKIFARMDRLGKAFTRIGKEIAIAVKSGGPDPDSNAKLRTIIKNAKGANMPKANIEAAIKRASEKGSANYEEMVYEGIGPAGIGIVVETATDNPNRTVANVRAIFTRNEVTLGKSGSLDFVFERKGVFKLKNEVPNVEELEFELIDFGCEEFMFDDEEGLIIFYTAFADFGQMNKAIEERNLPLVSAELERIPNNFIDVDEATAEKVFALIEKLEADDDVQLVFHNMK